LLDRNQPSCENNILLARAIARLSKRSGCYPDCLILSNVRRTREHPVAGGGFADVWQGISDGRPVALKALRIYAKPSREIALKEFCHEATIWRQLVHPNILPFYGVFKGDDAFDRLCLVSPWMDAGNVSTYLAMHTSADRISLLADVANGLDYLHLFVTPIVHGDLKGANIFVTNNLTACLGDFGLSHFKDSVDSTLGSTTGHTTGTLRWQAPELFQRGDDGHARRPSRETDSYSFGCVCLELITDRPPFSEIRTDFAVLAAIMNGETPRRPSVDLAHRGLDDSLWAVIEKCWHRDPNLRPTSKHLVQYFNLRRGLIGPDQVFMMPDGVEREINPASSLREGTVSEKVLQPLAATSPTASTTTYANGLFPNYQPRAHRQSARLLIRTLATTAAEAQAAAAAANNTSTTIAGPAPKKRKKDAPSDYAPPLKRSLTGNKHDNAIGAKTSRQRGGAATIENVS
ncbi:kinase-like protein, partial [Rickenella mellea]